jgi:hypothetical protein
VRIYCNLAILCLLMLSSGCASGALVKTAPSAIVSKIILPALCEEFFQNEAYDSRTTTVVLRETRPIYRTFALRVLHGSGPLTPAEFRLDDTRDDALRSLFEASAVDLPSGEQRCRWRAATKSSRDDSDLRALTLELSNITEDPFVEGTAGRFGVFARLSIGGEPGASWFWVALERLAESWTVDTISPLEISDD